VSSYTDLGFCQDVGGYSKEIVLSLPWGTELGKVGLIQGGPNQRPAGPSCLDVDSNNNVYLLDAGNKRVLIFNNTGELVNYFPIDDKYYYGASLIKFINNEGTIYIHDYKKKTFSSYTINGEFIARFSYNEDIGPLFTVEDGHVLGTVGYIPIKDVLRGDKNNVQEVVHDIDVQKQFRYSGKYSGILYDHEQDRYTSGVDRYVLHKPDNTTSVLEIKAVPLSYYTEFQCESVALESIYMAFPLGSENNGKPKVVLKYNKNMELVSKIEDMEFISNEKYFVERPLVFTEKGDVYTISLSEKGADIIKWVMK
jgi:hypothetical protein